MHETTKQDNSVSESKKKPASILKPAIVVLLWLLCITWYALRPSPEFVEAMYSRGFYRLVTSLITPLTSAVPFSIILLILSTAPLLFLLLWAANWIYRKRVKKLSHWRGMAWGIKWLFVIVPMVWLWFLVFWGMGYARQPVETRLNFDDQKVSEEELLRIKNALLPVILRDQPQHPGDRNVDRAIASVARSMQLLVAKWEERSIIIPHRVKATPPGLLLMNGTAGICAPFTLEPHVDGGLPDTSFVSVGAHELGHIAGVCDEGETNLIGYISGLQADDPYARYAVALNIYLDVARQLGGEERKTAVEKLPEQARQDMQRAREAQERYRIDWFQKWSWRAYNQYLKSQGVQEGVRSYGRGTKLLVQAWRAGYLNLPEDSKPEENHPVDSETAAGQFLT
jgi:hypothetical protein